MVDHKSFGPRAACIALSPYRFRLPVSDRGTSRETEALSSGARLSQNDNFPSSAGAAYRGDMAAIFALIWTRQLPWCEALGADANFGGVAHRIAPL
jgi:hypothetical protein